MVVVKFICCIIALFTTLLFISDVITSCTSDKFTIPKEDEPDPAMRHAAFRLILSIIMAISWSVLIVF